MVEAGPEMSCSSAKRRGLLPIRSHRSHIALASSSGTCVGLVLGREDRSRRQPKRIRSTNLLKRTFVEVRRRTKVIGRFPGETSALSLIWAVLELSSHGWRGVKMTPKTVTEIQRLRHALRTPHAASIDVKEVIAA